MNGFVQARQRFIDVKGRARRREFWWFVLMHFLIGVVISNFTAVIGLNRGFISFWFGRLLFFPYLSYLSVSMHRLYAVGRSGWWLLIEFVPILGFMLILWFARNGERGSSAYGPSPRYVG